MVANSFDLWQKDAFFSAAEEVQESADIMESAYRMWIKEKRKGLKTEDYAQLCRELQTALGTAKWQLEEFERATRLSRGHCRSDDTTATRHNQFIAAVESQIFRVEAALKESFSEEGKQPLRWVNLDEEECDDLAIFLSGTSPTLQASAKNTRMENHHKRKDADSDFDATCDGDTSEVKVAKDSSKDAECIIDVGDVETSGVSCGQERATGTRRTWSSPNFDALRIVIADEYDNITRVGSGIESTPKGKGSKQCSGCADGLLRHLQSPSRTLYDRAARIRNYVIRSMERLLRAVDQEREKCIFDLFVRRGRVDMAIGDIGVLLFRTTRPETLKPLFLTVFLRRCWIDFPRHRISIGGGEDCEPESRSRFVFKIGVKRRLELARTRKVTYDYP
ncbi:Syntaxin/t-SNARE family protein, putative isoform 2 [Hibiscus syriacus]|uniref:Syntaxin/t-SNARE family protein, putative isoform 2 n=1 Tax=Hibiscus syriacus TaxID=106335 RepID=A0A6A3CKA7_HIBSY|nr:Syntaxin/t-SNARE family protein, putative isoform 2 [Hibiscus syriacus]